MTLERGELTLVIKRVPAKVCPNCGEAYVDEAVATELLQTAERMARSGARGRCLLYRVAAPGEPAPMCGDCIRR